MSDTDYYRTLRENPPVIPKRDAWKGTWQLLWFYGPQSISVISDATYAACVAERQKRERDPAFVRGTFKIKPYKP